MSDVEVSIAVAAAPEAVWDVLVDFDCLGEWMEVHAGFPEPPPPLAPGVEFRQKLASGEIEAEVEWTVETVERPERLAWSGKGPGGTGARVDYALRADGDGCTRIEYRTDLELPGGPLGGVAVQAMIPKGREEAERALERLRDLVEARA